MRKIVYLLAFIVISSAAAKGNVGDTTWVQANHVNLNYYNDFDSTVIFPSGGTTYRKIYMIFTLGEYNCPSGTQYCHTWDYDIENYILTPTDTLEIGRLITPYGGSGTPGFSTAWHAHYIYDVTDYYNILAGQGTVRIHYSGYSGGFTGDIRFAFIEGTPERNVLGHQKIWNGGFAYGDPSSPSIDSTLLPQTITPPAGMQATELKLAITGHGYDSTSGCCEFDNATGAGHDYTISANNNTIAQVNMNVNCGWNELYPQNGTWLSARAGNWCPGQGPLTVAQYKLTGITAGSPGTVAMTFDDTYYGGYGNGAANPPLYPGSYKIAGTVFYYGAYNKTLDASMEDIIAPTDFEWYKRENPRVSIPVIKVRNTGSTAITSILFQYGVTDSALSQYIWVGTLAPSEDTILSLPASLALTNLSLAANGGQYKFVAEILQVNGQVDNDQSNDTITSHFSLAPSWPYTFVVQMKTSSIGANGSLGQNPADASWQITDMNNHVVASRTNANVTTTYNDTVTLNSTGFYALTVSTTQCYGLSWYIIAGSPGYTAGSFAVKDYNNNNTSLPFNNDNTGYFHDDFGCGFTQYFTTYGQCIPNTASISRIGDTLFSSSGSTYQWYYNGRLITGATNSSYGIQHNDGNYMVVVTDASGCVSNSASYAVVNLGVKDLADPLSVFISPNPSKDIFNISASSQLTGQSYTLSDVTGRIVESGIINGENTPISISSLSAGVFFLHINGQNKQSFKVVKD